MAFEKSPKILPVSNVTPPPEKTDREHKTFAGLQRRCNITLLIGVCDAHHRLRGSTFEGSQRISGIHWFIVALVLAGSWGLFASAIDRVVKPHEVGLLLA